MASLSEHDAQRSLDDMKDLERAITEILQQLRQLEGRAKAHEANLRRAVLWLQSRKGPSNDNSSNEDTESSDKLAFLHSRQGRFPSTILIDSLASMSPRRKIRLTPKPRYLQASFDV